MKPAFRLLVLLVVLAALSVPTQPVSAATTITVETNADALANNGLCSLREAITNANNNAATWSDCAAGSGADIIEFDADYTITLASQLPVVSTQMTINGRGVTKTIIQANANKNTANFRVFLVSSSGNLTLQKVTVRHGRCVGSCASPSGYGGGILINRGTLIVRNSAITDNVATNGGGIYNRGELFFGGGELTVTGSTFSGNAASYGGGISNCCYASTATIANSTFAANTATISGGAIRNSDFLTLRNSTLSGNSAGSSGAGVYNAGSLNYANVIIANSTSGGDCLSPGGIGTNVKNLVEDGSCAAALSGDPHLGPLARNGGPTKTMALLTGSPAIDAGDASWCSASPVSNKDQRGVTRPLDGDGNGTDVCDIGAFEQKRPTTIIITADTPDPSVPGRNVAVSVMVDTAGPTIPTGTVDITGADTNCTVTLSGGTGSCNVKFTSGGNKTLEAQYNGNATHQGSSDTEAHVVWFMLKFVSQPGRDGWVLESTETSAVGGTLDATAATLATGDDNQDRQYRSILSFNSSDLPDTATIKRVQLWVRESSVTGTNPAGTHGSFLADIKKPFFGSALTLGLDDFAATASLPGACTIGATPTAAGWYRCTLSSSALAYVSKTGLTQLRLRFATDDNDDNGADVLNLFSGNAISANRPYIIVYYTP